ncbi:short-chain dehydrogenase [Alsobacter metallidurans]|uniref:Short-chain dehydrogenase n=1 Tax=Alsobacter metallidurans TaxID=340221 RepID=A0A917MGC9_9HYPH|nr:SDR family oxidoreductase [Alsobacter metallidurans]GGH14129.1 short-chain dehydrogenase [Alsobacter metallidurans]
MPEAPRSNRLSGKVAVVTGGTQGLGEAIARHIAAAGAAGVVLTGRNAERGKRVADSLAASGCKAVFVQADLANHDEVARIIPAADEAFGRVDILVNAAGDTDRGTIFDTSPELYDRLMDVNLKAPFFLIQGAATLMRRDGIEGAIVNIQSMSAHGGQPFICAYSVSKGALATLTKNAAFSLMPWRIRVNGLNIGWMNTPGEDAIARKYHGAQDGWLEKAVATQPFGRLVDPDEVARATVFLASDEAGLMTGANIDLDQSVLGCWESAPRPNKPA